MFNLYAQHEPNGLMVRAGKPSMNIDRALERARKLRALQVEIRNEALPRRKSLVAIFRGGVQVTGATLAP